MTVVAAVDDPLSVLATNNSADVVRPDNDRTDGRATGVRAIVSPCAGEIVGWAGVAADLPTHVPPAPRTRPTRMPTGIMLMMITANMVVIVTMVVVRSSLYLRSEQAKHCRCSHESTHHGYPCSGKIALGDQESRLRGARVPSGAV
jgi:hypothetical protein